MHDYSKEMWMVIGENRMVVLDRQKLNGHRIKCNLFIEIFILTVLKLLSLGFNFVSF